MWPSSFAFVKKYVVTPQIIRDFATIQSFGQARHLSKHVKQLLFEIQYTEAATRYLATISRKASRQARRTSGDRFFSSGILSSSLGCLLDWNWMCLSQSNKVGQHQYKDFHNIHRLFQSITFLKTKKICEIFSY